MRESWIRFPVIPVLVLQVVVNSVGVTRAPCRRERLGRSRLGEELSRHLEALGNESIVTIVRLPPVKGFPIFLACHLRTRRPHQRDVLSKHNIGELVAVVFVGLPSDFNAAVFIIQAKYDGVAFQLVVTLDDRRSIGGNGGSLRMVELVIVRIVARSRVVARCGHLSTCLGVGGGGFHIDVYALI